MCSSYDPGIDENISPSVSHLLSPPCTIISRTSFPWSLVYSLANIFTHPIWCCGYEGAGKMIFH